MPRSALSIPTSEKFESTRNLSLKNTSRVILPTHALHMLLIVGAVAVNDVLTPIRVVQVLVRLIQVPALRFVFDARDQSVSTIAYDRVILCPVPYTRQKAEDKGSFGGVEAEGVAAQGSRAGSYCRDNWLEGQDPQDAGDGFDGGHGLVGVQVVDELKKREGILEGGGAVGLAVVAFVSGKVP